MKKGGWLLEKERRKKRQEERHGKEKGRNERKRIHPLERESAKKGWRRKNKSAPSSIHGALMCHLTEIPPDSQELIYSRTLRRCARAWSCVMYEGGWAGSSVSIREIAATSSTRKGREGPVSEEELRVKFVLLFPGKDVGKRRIINRADDESFPGDN